MECDLCHRLHDAQRQPFLCPVDARNAIYEGRLKYLRLLLENEALQSQITELLANTLEPGKGVWDEALAQQDTEELKTDGILAAADKLREEIKSAKEEIRVRKAALARRRSDLTSVSAGLAERRARQQKDIERSISMLKFRWSQTAQDMATTRAFLCTEAARLYGLKRITKKGGTGRYEYQLGRLPIVDLASMDAVPPDVISTSLSHIAHILVLVSHYLAIRLPAEITLPHRDYPRPTMFNLQSSYHHGDVFFPGTQVALAYIVESPGANGRVPRPRPLFVDKALPQLSKEDPAAYSLFLEGATLLAYNIAWLCCSQGVPIGDKSSFDDICNMGRNLYNLLINHQIQGANNISVGAPGATSATDDSQGAGATQTWLGRYSHGTAYYFIGGAEGTEVVKNFKLPSPLKLADKLKRKLLGDAPAPDWEVLDDDAWREDGVGGNGGVETKAHTDKVENADLKGSPRTGSNGWMKVKSR